MKNIFINHKSTDIDLLTQQQNQMRKIRHTFLSIVLMIQYDQNDLFLEEEAFLQGHVSPEQISPYMLHNQLLLLFH